MEFSAYLSNCTAPSTYKRYLRELDLFFLSIDHPKTATYSDLIAYLGALQKRIKNRTCALSAIRKYYQYLVDTGQRIDNPSTSIKLRDKRNREIQLQDLFKTRELEQLLERKERYPILKNRNKIIISLMIYQGLSNGELCRLTIRDINFEKGSIYIKARLKSNERILKLKSQQIFWMLKYLQEDRVKLIKIKSDKLLINKLGNAETGEGITYLIETQKHLFKDRKLSPLTIRQSVIRNLLNEGKDLRKVQVFVGHKTVGSTEKYKQTKVEVLKNELLKYHPLDT